MSLTLEHLPKPPDGYWWAATWPAGKHCLHLLLCSEATPVIREVVPLAELGGSDMDARLHLRTVATKMLGRLKANG